MAARQYSLATPIVHGYYKQKKPVYRTINYDRVNTNTSAKQFSGKKATKRKSPVASSMSRWWLVLPCVLLITLVSAPDALVMNDFIVRRYELRYGLETSEKEQRIACLQTPSATIRYWYLDQYSNSAAEYDKVLKDAAKFNIKNSIVTLIPSLFAIVLLGSNCDTIGRRPLLILPFVGKVIRYSVMLAIVSRDLPDEWLLVNHACEALFGSFGIVMLSALAYITDCTKDSKRTRPFLVTEIIALLARIIPMLVVGLWLQRFRYIIPTSVSLALSIIGLLYGLFIQPESVRSVQNESLIRQIARIRLKPIARCVQVFFIKRPGYNQRHLFLISITNILVLLMLFGYMGVVALFAYGRPFCMDALYVGLVAATYAISAVVFTLIVSLFKSRHLDKTYFLPIVGLLALMTDFLIFSLSKWSWLLFIAASIGSLFFITMPVLRSKLSRLVEPSEYAIVFIAAAFIEAGGDKAVDAASNAIYHASLHFWPGLVFFVLASVGILPLIIMCYLAYSEKKTVPIVAVQIDTIA